MYITRAMLLAKVAAFEEEIQNMQDTLAAIWEEAEDIEDAKDMAFDALPPEITQGDLIEAIAV